MSGNLKGMLEWSSTRDRDGHRDYEVSWLLYADDFDDGPLTMMYSPELPVPGSYWAYGNDLDIWAYCSPEMTVKPVLTREPNLWWIVDQKFSTRPLRRCQDDTIEDPLAEPFRIGGSFVTYQELAHFDKDANPIVNTSGEPIIGADNEWDASRPTVTIGFNTGSLPLTLFAPLMHYVNDSTLWGLPARCVKLSSAEWKRVLFGSCSYYYTIDYQFDIRYDTFDRTIDNYCKKKYKGSGSHSDPASFEVCKDVKGNIIDGGLPCDSSSVPVTDINSVYKLVVKKYYEGNLLTLGIPSSLG